MTLTTEDNEFLQGMVSQLDETIRKLVEEDKVLCEKLGETRVAELKEFCNHELSPEEEVEFKRTLDYCDKILIRCWLDLRRKHQTRAHVGKAFMKFNSKL